MSEIKSLKEVVETLIEREYENETGKLIDDEDFRLLAEFAVIKAPTKTDQQRRDEIVERAKRDVAKIIGKYDSFNITIGRFNNQAVTAKFVVNAEKRTVVALIYGYYSKDLYYRGIAKCAPKDCFNVHIGKAIALRRALNLEVPDEYLNAPQPTEVRVGDFIFAMGKVRKVVSSDDEVCVYTNPPTCNIKSAMTTSLLERIIDDSREGVAE